MVYLLRFIIMSMFAWTCLVMRDYFFDGQSGMTSNYRDRNTNLLPYAGKGTFEFIIKPLPLEVPAFIISLHDKVRKEVATLIFTDDDVVISGKNFGKLRNKPEMQLKFLHFQANFATIWVSISSRRPAFIKVGHGYRMEANVLFWFCSSNNGGEDPALDATLANVTSFVLGSNIDVISQRTFPDSVTVDPSPKLILPSKRDRSHDVASDGKYYMPVTRLPSVAIGFVEQLANWFLTEEEIAAIKYSLDMPGGILNKILQNKDKQAFDHNGGRASYLRVPLQESRLTAPGEELVLEIWPMARATPIHNHGNSAAVIKVLYGSLRAEWYNPLVNGTNETQHIIGFDTIDKGEYTWMLSHIYQTHRLVNIAVDSISISIQAFGYEDDLDERQDCFYYFEGNSTVLREFHPTTDLVFEDISGRILAEYRSQNEQLHTINKINLIK